MCLEVLKSIDTEINEAYAEQGRAVEYSTGTITDVVGVDGPIERAILSAVQ